VIDPIIESHRDSQDLTIENLAEGMSRRIRNLASGTALLTALAEAKDGRRRWDKLNKIMEKLAEVGGLTESRLNQNKLQNPN
jgi:hypothetical protein